MPTASLNSPALRRCGFRYVLAIADALFSPEAQQDVCLRFLLLRKKPEEEGEKEGEEEKETVGGESEAKLVLPGVEETSSCAKGNLPFRLPDMAARSEDRGGVSKMASGGGADLCESKRRVSERRLS